MLAATHTPCGRQAETSADEWALIRFWRQVLATAVLP